MAPHRLGGAGKGCHVPAASSPVKHKEAAASDVASDSDNSDASDSASEAAASAESADD